jgi:hypothetical protein
MERLAELTPERFEILVVRELRKAGFEVDAWRRARRARVEGSDPGDALGWTATLAARGRRWRAWCAARRQARACTADDVAETDAQRAEAGAEVALLFAACELEDAAVARARALGVALFRVLDGRTAFREAGWDAGPEPPAWWPAHVAALVEPAPGAGWRIRLLEAGRVEPVVEAWPEAARRPPGEGAGSGGDGDLI